MDNKDISKNVVSGAISIGIGLAVLKVSASFLRLGTRRLLDAMDGVVDKIPAKSS
jgi:hypothetical protein